MTNNAHTHQANFIEREGNGTHNQTNEQRHHHQQQQQQKINLQRKNLFNIF